jgi:hypothetical protein
MEEKLKGIKREVKRTNVLLSLLFNFPITSKLLKNKQYELEF